MSTASRSRRSSDCQSGNTSPPRWPINSSSVTPWLLVLMPNHFVPLPIYCIAGYTSSSSLQRQGGSGISFPNRSAKQCAMAASGGATPSSADLSTSDIFADLERLQPATAQDVAGALASKPCSRVACGLSW